MRVHSARRAAEREGASKQCTQSNSSGNSLGVRYQSSRFDETSQLDGLKCQLETYCAVIGTYLSL
jgi:hypothetical protein